MAQAQAAIVDFCNRMVQQNALKALRLQIFSSPTRSSGPGSSRTLELLAIEDETVSDDVPLARSCAPLKGDQLATRGEAKPGPVGIFCLSCGTL